MIPALARQRDGGHKHFLVILKLAGNLGGMVIQTGGIRRKRSNIDWRFVHSRFDCGDEAFFPVQPFNLPCTQTGKNGQHGNRDQRRPQANRKNAAENSQRSHTGYSVMADFPYQ